MVLSAIRIQSLWCSPYVQRLMKAICFTKHDALIKINSKTKYRGIYRILFPLMFLSCAPTVHAMPGTNHVLIKDQGSSDISQQRKYIKTIITKLNNDATATANASATSDVNITSTKAKTTISRLPQ